LFLNIDLRSRYHHIHIKENDIYKTTFRTRHGHDEFVVVTFGITDAPNTFMCLMNHVLHFYLDKFVMVFIDDIFIYYKNEEEHLEHLETMLRLIREHQFLTKITKCNPF